MSPAFFHDYCPAITREIQWVTAFSGFRQVDVPKFRVQATDADGNAMIGAFSWMNFDEAYWRLCDFIDGELERRGALLP